MLNKELIETALYSLRQLKFEEKECSILAETGLDESIFIGTNDCYARLALYLLEIVDAGMNKENDNPNLDFEFDKIGEVKCYSSGDLKNYFSDNADVLPVSLYVVENDVDKERIQKHLKP